MKQDKLNNSSYRFAKDNKGFKNKPEYDNEFASEYDFEDRQLNLERDEINSYTKNNKKSKSKKDKGC